MADFDKVLELCPGKKKLNLHASYAIMDKPVGRNKIEPKHYAKWVEYATQNFMYPRLVVGLYQAQAYCCRESGCQKRIRYA